MSVNILVDTGSQSESACAIGTEIKTNAATMQPMYFDTMLVPPVGKLYLNKSLANYYSTHFADISHQPDFDLFSNTAIHSSGAFIAYPNGFAAD